jgi:hypothetical protein
LFNRTANRVSPGIARKSSSPPPAPCPNPAEQNAHTTTTPTNTVTPAVLRLLFVSISTSVSRPLDARPKKITANTALPWGSSMQLDDTPALNSSCYLHQYILLTQDVNKNPLTCLPLHVAGYFFFKT